MIIANLCQYFQAVEMLSNTRGSVPMIFFVTDGSVEDERHICNVMKKRLASSGSVPPRIHTFGLGKTFPLRL